MHVRTAFTALILVAVLVLGSVSTASAAVVSVSNALNLQMNTSQLELRAAAGEDNDVTLVRANRTEHDYEIEVTDLGAPLEAGAGCSGGGAKAICLLHQPEYPRYESCGHDCERVIPGTAWEARVAADLGDGDNKFDGSPLDKLGQISFTVTSGDGDDQITTCDGKDRIDPGAGSDEIHTGDEDDYVEATATPDGPDLYDLGPGEMDQVSYRRRSDPVDLSGNTAGAAGENDSLVGVEKVAGGSGADVLNGGPVYRLVGNAGDDRITGSDGKDLIAGGEGNDVLFGGGDVDNITGDLGDDILDGGEGNDALSDHIDWLSNPGEAQGGADIAYGRGGNDRIELGNGGDRAEGGADSDLIFGGEGNDVLSGDDGQDLVAGEGGADQMLGGAGADHLLASRSPQPLFTKSLPLDYGSDQVDCGAENDHALVNPWDRVRDCEAMRSSPHFKLRRERPHLNRATLLSAVISASGQVSISGPGVKAVRHHARVEAPPNRQGRHAVRLLVRPKGRALATLQREGRVRVAVTVRFKADGGVIQTARTRVTVTRRR